MSKLQVTQSAIKKSIVAAVGGLVVVVGIVLIPYPGPGWLIVFAGLAILATEFDRAQEVLDHAKGKYDKWQAWLKHQTNIIKVVFWLLTFTVVIVTIWLLNGYGYINYFLHLGWNWVRSPLPIFQ